MSDRVAIITGGGRGIGRAVSIQLARDGYSIAALARNERELAETASLVVEGGAQCLILPTDVCDPEQVDRAVSAVVERFGRIDVLVNNAGVAPMGKVSEMPLETFEQCVRVNVNAVFYCCRAVLKVMAAEGSGIIVNISSVAAVDPFPGFAAYGATKAWVNTFTKALAGEVACHNVRVFAVAPGAVETSLLRSAVPDFPADQALAPSDVAEMVSALLDSRCRHASGEVICVKKS